MLGWKEEGKFRVWVWRGNAGQSSEIFSGKSEGLIFFFPLSSSGSSSQTSDKPVAHVVGKSSEDVSGG